MFQQQRTRRPQAHSFWRASIRMRSMCLSMHNKQRSHFAQAPACLCHVLVRRVNKNVYAISKQNTKQRDGQIRDKNDKYYFVSFAIQILLCAGDVCGELPGDGRLGGRFCKTKPRIETMKKTRKKSGNDQNNINAEKEQEAEAVRIQMQINCINLPKKQNI